MSFNTDTSYLPPPLVFALSVIINTHISVVREETERQIETEEHFHLVPPIDREDEDVSRVTPGQRRTVLAESNVHVGPFAQLRTFLFVDFVSLASVVQSGKGR